jgi:hypothetical protein
MTTGAAVAIAVGAGILLGRIGRWLSAWRLDRRIDGLAATTAEKRLQEALQLVHRRRTGTA